MGAWRLNLKRSMNMKNCCVDESSVARSPRDGMFTMQFMFWEVKGTSNSNLALIQQTRKPQSKNLFVRHTKLEENFFDELTLKCVKLFLDRGKRSRKLRRRDLTLLIVTTKISLHFISGNSQLYDGNLILSRKKREVWHSPQFCN